jgi:C4-dicarboxylate-specific signal transduction histidine kinase
MAKKECDMHRKVVVRRRKKVEEEKKEEKEEKETTTKRVRGKSKSRQKKQKYSWLLIISRQKANHFLARAQKKYLKVKS